MVEDNPADAALIRRKLVTSGLQVDADEVCNSTEFLERLSIKPYDVVLCDFTIPGWSGMDALRLLRRSGFDLPFIYVSATLGEDVAVECIKEGATDYVRKDNLDRLPHSVRRALEEHELRRQKDQIEQERRESAEQYRLLFEGNPHPMWVYDRGTFRFLAVNEAAIRHYGYSRSEFLAMTILDIRPPVDVVPLLRSVLADQAHGLQKAEMWRHRLKDGTIIDVEITSHDLTFQGRDAELILANDVTNVRRSQEKLHQSEEKFSKAFRSSPAAVTISTLAEGRYIDANEGFCRMIGRRRGEVIGRTSMDLALWENPQDRVTMAGELSRTGQVRSFETVFLSSQGTRKTVQISAESIELDRVPCVLAITNDVTEAKSMEEQFRQAQKMEAVGRLAGGVAHDFNNMLGVIMGYCDLTLDVDNLNGVRTNVMQIKKAAQRSAVLTRQLLAFSRQQILRPSVLNLNNVVKDLHTMLLRIIAADIDLKFGPSSPLGHVKADVGQLEQILMNLVVNARDAMPHGGTIFIETANVELDEIYVRQYPRVLPGSYVALSVTDTGCGMDAETISKIFEPFFTTKPSGQGTGLGLSTVYGAMQQAGGHITVYSERGKGTTFKLYFPRIEEPETRALITSEVQGVKGTETVLLVEDEHDLCEITRELLESEGYRVLTAADGHAAIAQSANYPEPIHVLLTDVVMPGMSGNELAMRILETRPDLKVLYMSGYSGNLVAHQDLLETGAVLIEKPFTREGLLRRLRGCLASEPLSPDCKREES
jgi:PAS domain S-box-containing protein